MATRIYTGVDGKAREVKRIYVGVDGKARSVKKVYVGVNGKARLCWRQPGIYKYTGNIDPLSDRVYDVCGGSVGNYAIFAGGNNTGLDGTHSTNAGSTMADAYTSTLTKTSIASLGNPRRSLQSATIGNYILFSDGVVSERPNIHTLDVYDSQLSKIRSSASKELSNAPQSAASTAGNYAIFAGGRPSIKGGSKFVNAFDKSLTGVNCANFPHTVYGLAASHVNNCAAFAGGIGGRFSVAMNTTSNVIMYNSDLTQIKCTGLTNPTSNLCGACTETHMFFAGGFNKESPQGPYETVDAYDTSFTKISADPLSIGSMNMAGATLAGRYVVFAGGNNRDVPMNYAGSSDTVCGAFSYVTMYDSDIVKQSLDKLTIGRGWLGAASVGDYVIFAGGSRTFYGSGDGYPETDTVDVYEYV